MRQLTAGDIRSLAYFHQEKGDMARYAYFEELRPALAAQFPEVLDAYDRLKIAQRTLDAVVANMERNAPDDDDD